MTDSATAILHPRPRLTRPRWIDLNGPWQFGYDNDDKGLDGRWHVAGQGEFDRTITVPFPPESALSGVADTGFHPIVWYRRSFSAVPDAGGRLLLHFGAVDYRAKVWVNGELVAEHEGGHTPFSADITANLVQTGEQVVVVRAEDRPGDMTQPRGKQDWLEQPHSIWYNRTTGIWQTVWLEPVPATYVEELQFTPDIASASVKVEAGFNRATGATLMLTLRSEDTVLARQYVVAQGKALETTITIPALRNGVFRDGLLWTPDRPNLISVTAQLVDDSGEEIDAVDSYLGLRTTTIGNGRFLLNDRPVFIRSVLEQGYWPQSHLAAPSADALREEVELIKSLGFNAVRIHQKVEDPRFLYWADHLGLMVWGEMANAFEFSAPAVDKFTREWLSAVKRDRSHPSVVTWTPLNESWGVPDIALSEAQQHYASGLYHLTKALDPSRPVISNDGWEHTTSDIWGLHDYTQYPEQITDRYGTAEAVAKTLTEMRPTRKRLLLDPTDRRGQPVMITEFGGLSYYPAAGKAWFGYATAQNEAEYLSMMKGLFDAIYASPDIAGFCYTQITDTLQETNGLLDENRKPKLPLEKLRDIIWQPSQAVPSEFLDIARQKALRVSSGQVV